MKRIDNFSSIEGRLMLQDIFHKLRFERQRSGIATLFILWRICTSDTEINQYVKENIIVMHKLGLLRGTVLWLEEVVNRYYISTFNSFLYFGAAVLLVIIAINRFSDKLDDAFVIYGMCFEATMLIMMFIVMLFTPNDDVSSMTNDDEQSGLEKELLNEIGEISRDFAVTSTQLDKITDHLQSIVDSQNELSKTLLEIAKTNEAIINPNPKMIELMQQTNNELADFKSNLLELNNTAKQIKQTEIQISVRKELEKYFVDKI